MGANLVPIVRNFSIHNEVFPPNDHSVLDGCVMPGPHRVMRFDFLSHNIGNEDLVVGAPADHPEWFVFSGAHGHFHLKDFNEFVLLDASGNQVTRSYKQAFCLIDVEHRSTWGSALPKFTDCNSNQGVSAGWADLYHKTLACQFIVIDGVPDGDYILVSTTNTRQILPEETFADNTIHTTLRISGNSVTVLNPIYTMMSVVNGLVADIKGGSMSDGAQLILWDWHSGANQRWKMIPLTGADEGYHQILSVNSGLVLGVEDSSHENGARIVQRHPQTDNEKWLFIWVDEKHLYIQNKNSGLVMDVKEVEEPYVIQWPLHGGPNQTWTLIPESS